ncbi:MAG TPA: diaminopimelate epimerase [Puia sp.]|uniref:diaminopimelate epimerase n=1 Tax=Puia sp. TaxID=2045100 RepID=UPI002D1609EC|nr:diaminopimelate epimerase [Puia sp.]HVU94628.1 diaminopimelate epimerase [Puia sp.]
MNQMHFFKYQGTGNDFIILDNRNWSYTALTTERIKFLCDRRFGIGADGLMLLNPHTGYDFEMKYYNADGRESTMCGNGGRCLVKFANDIGLKKTEYSFIAADGPHLAEIDDDSVVSLKMKNVAEIHDFHGDFLLDTGSPHYVRMVTDVMELDVYHKGMEIRYSSDFAKEGVNVNFVEHRRPDEIIVRTYERGVEDETLSCGTGVTASALACYHNEAGYNYVKVITKGGKLTVRFDRTADGAYENIWLCGPAVRVFEGSIDN